MAAVASEGAAGAHHRLAPRLRAAVLGPRGGGTTRRRASDAFRLGFAAVVVAVSVPVMRANSAVELSEPSVTPATAKQAGGQIACLSIARAWRERPLLPPTGSRAGRAPPRSSIRT
jgi:hypothetical protein